MLGLRRPPEDAMPSLSLPSLAVNKLPVDERRGSSSFLTPRSRRLATLPAIKEDENVQQQSLEELDMQSFSSLAKELVRLCHALSKQPQQPASPSRRSPPQPLASWTDPSMSHVANRAASSEPPPLLSKRAGSTPMSYDGGERQWGRTVV